MRPTPLDYAAEDVDAAIALDTGARPGIARHRIVGDRRVPVCAPALTVGGALATVADLARHTLLQHSIQPRAWTDWRAMMGATGIDGVRGPRFQHHAMVAEAAAQGMGVALMPRFMVAAELATGRLVVPFDQALDVGDYVLAYPEASADLPALRLLRFGCWRKRKPEGASPPQARPPKAAPLACRPGHRTHLAARGGIPSGYCAARRRSVTTASSSPAAFRMTPYAASACSGSISP